MIQYLSIIIAICIVVLVVILTPLKKEDLLFLILKKEENKNADQNKEIKVPENGLNNLGRNPKDPRGRR
jgi:type IV secretory pathway component VirB8